MARSVSATPVATRPTEPLRAEHRELLPHIERLRRVADRIGDAAAPALRAELDEAYTFLTGHLVPHATAEDEVLYPAVARILGSPKATATMSRDHTAVAALIDELGVLRHAAADEHARDLRRILYGLHAMVSTHFAKEEEIYLPLLDEHLTPEEASRLFASMEQAAGRIKARMLTVR